MKRTIPMLITTAAGIFLVAKFFLKNDFVNNVANEIEQWCVVIFAFAIVLGVANITRVNLMTIVKRRQDWQYKVVLLVTMCITIIAGLITLFSGKELIGDNFFTWIYNHILYPLSVTMYASLAFYIASAAFRAFRARNVAATFMLTAAILVMLGRVPLGAALSPYLPNLANWIMSFPNAAGQRGIIIGAAVGVITVGLKIITGIERPYLK